MPYERPGQGHYTTATKATTHGALVVEDSVVGIAIKQKAVSWQAGLAAQNQIGIGEAFHIRTKGVRQVPFLAGSVKGTSLYIITATNVLTASAQTAPTGYKVGKVVEVQGQRGTPTGFMRVDLDLKDSF
jgi:hypothetical protein